MFTSKVAVVTKGAYVKVTVVHTKRTDRGQPAVRHKMFLVRRLVGDEKNTNIKCGCPIARHSPLKETA